MPWCTADSPDPVCVPGCIRASKPRALAHQEQGLATSRSHKTTTPSPRTQNGRGPSLVRVHDIQACRHVSENVQHVRDLWTEANMGDMACYRRWACFMGRAGPPLHLEGSAVVVQQAARGAVPEVHHQQQVRRGLGAAHADESMGRGLNGPVECEPSEPSAYMPWTMRTFLCFGFVMSTSSRCMSSNT